MPYATTKAVSPPQYTNEAKRLSDIYESVYMPLLMIGLLGVSWYTSFTGVLAMAEFMSEISDRLRQIAALVTAAAMGAQYALWHFSIRLIPRYATYQARGIGIVILLVLITLLALSSTVTSFIGLAQDSARGLELQRQSDLYAEKARILAPRTGALEDALLAIEPSANAACVRYEQELSSGVITGSRGKGVVTGQFLKICETKRGMVDAIEQTIAANTQRMNKFQRLSAQLDAIIYERGKPIAEREKTFIELARSMDALLQELQNADRTKGLRASSDALGNSIAELEVTGGGLAAVQAQAVRGIIQEEAAASTAINQLIDV